MSDVLLSLAVIGGVGAVLVVLSLVAVRVRRSGTAGPALGAAMAAYDEAMHSSAYDTFVEIQAQDDRPASTTRAGDADPAGLIDRI